MNENLKLIRLWRDGVIEGNHLTPHEIGKGGMPLEEHSGWVCWAFPGDWVSAYNGTEPVLTEEDFIALRNPEDQAKQLDLLHSYKIHLMEFQGWSRGPDHNRRRITRVLKSLVLQDMEEAALNFYEWCVNQAVPNTPQEQITNTLIYWNGAVCGI